MDSEYSEEESSGRAISPLPLKSGWKHHTIRATKKFVEVVTRFATSIIACYPRLPQCRREQPLPQPTLLDLPNEMLVQILSYLDSPSRMTMRAVNRRFHSLVDASAHHSTRINLVGGVEIGNGGEEPTAIGASDDGEPSSCSPRHLTLRRPTKRREILVPAYRLASIMKHVCVCHSLRLCGVPLDEEMARDLLDASFRTVSDFIVDRVHSVTSDTLKQLVERVYPSKILMIMNHNSASSESAITSAVFDNCPAGDVSVVSDIVHRLIDDEALSRLILCDLTVRRRIRLPLCAITHHGILSAATQFFKRCHEILDEVTGEMQPPVWEVTVSLPRSSLIDGRQLIPSAEMLPHCVVLQFAQTHALFFQVLVSTMFLRVLIE